MFSVFVWVKHKMKRNYMNSNNILMLLANIIEFYMATTNFISFTRPWFHIKPFLT